jgi:2-haloalkanoic acid dehalogenase type II
LTGRQPITAVTFDGDGTLWDFEAAMRAALEHAAATLRAAGLRREGGEEVTADWLKQVRDEVAARPEMSRASMEAIRRESFHDAVGRDAGRAELADAVYERYMDDRFALLELFPDVHDTLGRLRGHVRLALVTNGNTHPTRVGLGELFDDVVIAFECGYQKPDPRIYDLVARRLGVAPAGCAHVGDHPTEDVEAARAAGMTGVWINRLGAAWPSSVPPPDLEIHDLAGLAALV